MSGISDEEMEHLAVLSNMKLNAKEKEGLKRDLSRIVEYVNQLAGRGKCGADLSGGRFAECDARR